MQVTHTKTVNIADWTQSDLNAAIALGQFPAGTLLADIQLPSDWNAQHTASLAAADIEPILHAATSKTAPVDADELPLIDSAASNVLKKLTWADLKATFKIPPSFTAFV